MDWGSTLAGGLGGATTGAMIGSAFPVVGTGIGAGIGGGIGLTTGFLSGLAREDAAHSQKANIEGAMKRLQALSQQQYAQRQQDLGKIMAFYGPVQQRLERMYGPGAGGPGFSPSPPAGSNPIARMMG